MSPNRVHFPPPPPWHRELTSVGVTGTNGKTSTVTFLAAALGRHTAPVSRVTTLGLYRDDVKLDVAPSHDALLSLTKSSLASGGRFVALEVTSVALAHGFARAWPMRFGVFTNLSHDHLNAHKTAEHYLASKAQLFMGLPEDGAAILNGCDPASELLQEVIPEGVPVVRYGVASRGELSSGLDAIGSHICVGLDGTTMSLGGTLGRIGPAMLRTRAVGRVFAENALAAWTAAVTMGVDHVVAADAIAHAPPPPGRFQIVGNEPLVVVDYAHTPDALERTLETARELSEGGVIVVFGAGGDRDALKRPLLGAACAKATRVILTTDNPRSENPAVIADSIREGIPPGVEVLQELDREAAIRVGIGLAGPKDVVILAGRGHEDTQQTLHHRRLFRDADVAERVLRERGLLAGQR